MDQLVENPMKAIERATSGVTGLDDILHGGLPADRLYLVEGNPGTGKTTLALQFLLEGIRRGEKVLYVTLSETKEEILQVAASHGWSLDGMDLFELDSIEERFHEQDQYTIFPASEVELGETAKKIFAHISQREPVRIAFDSLSEMRLLAADPLRYRRQILAVKHFFAKRKGTVLLLDDRTADKNDLQLQSICHGVLMLEERPTDHSGTRSRLRVVKMRGAEFEKGFHDYTIYRGGIVVYPRLVASQAKMFSFTKEDRRSSRSGVGELDTLLGGGLDHGSSTLILGPAGAGKSTIATQFLWNGAQRGERAICCLFEESRSVYLQRASGLGQNLEPYLANKTLSLFQVDPSSLSPGEFSAKIKQAVVSEKATMVVIDSLNGYLNAMPNEKHLLIHFHELLMFLNEHKVLTLMIMAQHGMLGSTMTQPVDVSYMADTVLLLRFFEASGRVRKAISVVKKRTGPHEDTIREFRLSEKGLMIGEPLTQFQGVLGGIPRFTGSESSLIEDNDAKTRG